MKQIVKQLLAALCCVTLLACMGPAEHILANSEDPLNDQRASADEQSDQDGGSSVRPMAGEAEASLFYNVSITKTSGSSGTTFGPAETVAVHMDFRADSLQPGYATTVTLPAELWVASAPPFDLINTAGGQSIATATINAFDNTITIVFNDNVAGLENITGRLSYTAKFQSHRLDGDGSYEIIVRVGETGRFPVPVQIKKTTMDLNVPVYKSGSQSSGSASWTIYVNFDLQTLTDVVVTDTAGNGHIIDGSITVYHFTGLYHKDNGTFGYDSFDDISDQVDIDILDDSTFTVSLGNITDGYAVAYRSRVTDSSVKTYVNTVELDAAELNNAAYYRASVYWDYGGSATGDRSGRLKLIKTDAETGAPLEGARFDLLDAADNLVAELITDKNGIATADNLEVGATYYLEETGAPSGYKLSETRTEVTITGSDELPVEITNILLSDPDPDPDPGPDPAPDPTPTTRERTRSGNGASNLPDDQTVPNFSTNVADPEEFVDADNAAAANQADEQAHAAIENPNTGAASTVRLTATAMTALGGATLFRRLGKKNDDN